LADRNPEMDVSENSGTSKSSILIGFSIISHPFWSTPIFGNTHMFVENEGIMDEQFIWDMNKAT